MKKKEGALTYEQAVEVYFGGIHALAASKLPFKCKCGAGVWHLTEMWSHVRKEHNERIKKMRLAQPD